MGPKLAEFLLEGDGGGRSAVSGIGAIFHCGHQTGERREDSASDRRPGNWGRESDAGSNRPRTVSLSLGAKKMLRHFCSAQAIAAEYSATPRNSAVMLRRRAFA